MANTPQSKIKATEGLPYVTINANGTDYKVSQISSKLSEIIGTQSGFSGTDSKLSQILLKLSEIIGTKSGTFGTDSKLNYRSESDSKQLKN